jgi:ferredoxin
MAITTSAAVAMDARSGELYFPLVEESRVAYIICEPCIGTKDSACVDVCPVDCIHPRKDEPAFATTEMLYIHPDECIDCGACVPACPVEAIYALDETPEKWKQFIPVNAEYYQK